MGRRDAETQTNKETGSAGHAHHAVRVLGVVTCPGALRLEQICAQALAAGDLRTEEGWAHAEGGWAHVEVVLCEAVEGHVGPEAADRRAGRARVCLLCWHGGRGVSCRAQHSLGVGSGACR